MKVKKKMEITLNMIEKEKSYLAFEGVGNHRDEIVLLVKSLANIISVAPPASVDLIFRWCNSVFFSCQFLSLLNQEINLESLISVNVSSSRKSYFLFIAVHLLPLNC